MKLRKRISRSHRGMTLTETLISLLLLLLLTLIATSGITAAARVYRKAVTVANVGTLSSTISQGLEDELRYARNIHHSGATVTIDGSTYPEVAFELPALGSDVSVATVDGRIGLMLDEAFYPLFSDAVYTDNLSAGAEVGYASGSFHIQVEILDDTGAVVNTVTFSIAALNA